MSDDKQVNLSFLDKSIDDIEDLAGFAVPPNGLYSLKFSTVTKVVNDKDAVEAAFEVIEAVEINDASQAGDASAKPGTKFSTLFFLDNDIALGRMKELLLPVALHFAETNLKVLITETCKDLIVVAKVKRRADKTDKDKFYADVSNLTIS